MHRRQLLATTASATLLPLTGCMSGWSEPTDLGSPREELDADGSEQHLIFTRDSDRQAVLTVAQRFRPPSLDQQVPFRLHVWHRDALRIDRMAFELRAPPHSAGVPAAVFLQVPDGGPWPEFELRKDDDLWTVIAVDELGRLGNGSLGLDLVVDPVGDPLDELAVRAEVEFSGTGLLDRRYRATANTRFDILPARERR